MTSRTTPAVPSRHSNARPRNEGIRGVKHSAAAIDKYIRNYNLLELDLGRDAEHLMKSERDAPPFPGFRREAEGGPVQRHQEA